MDSPSALTGHASRLSRYLRDQLMLQRQCLAYINAAFCYILELVSNVGVPPHD